VWAEWRAQECEGIAPEIAAALDAWKRSKKWRDGFAEGGHRWLKNRQWENLPEVENASPARLQTPVCRDCGADRQRLDDGGRCAVCREKRRLMRGEPTTIGDLLGGNE